MLKTKKVCIMYTRYVYTAHTILVYPVATGDTILVYPVCTGYRAKSQNTYKSVCTKSNLTTV